jgi:hypothetical protein
MALVLFLCLLAATANPIHKLAQRVLEYDATHLNKPQSNHLLERCLHGFPVLLEGPAQTHLPSDGRALGDPCAYDAQCSQPNKCLCQLTGGKECAPATCEPVPGIKIPADGKNHRVNCQLTCQCQGSGFGCVDTCPLSMIACPPGQEQYQVPVDECCFTWACRPSARLSWQSWNSNYQVVGGVSVADLLAQVHDSSAGYCTKSLTNLGALSNQGVCGGSNSNIGELITIEWNQDCDQTGSLRMGVDWGYGGALIVDGAIVRTLQTNSNYNWWNGNWGDTGSVITLTNKVWTKGHHKVQFIGFEPCCDGNQVVQFKAKDDPNWHDLTDAFLTSKFGTCPIGCTNEPNCTYPDPYCFYSSPERDANGCIISCGPLACA